MEQNATWGLGVLLKSTAQTVLWRHGLFCFSPVAPAPPLFFHFREPETKLEKEHDAEHDKNCSLLPAWLLRPHRLKMTKTISAQGPVAKEALPPGGPANARALPPTVRVNSFLFNRRGAGAPAQNLTPVRRARGCSKRYNGQRGPVTIFSLGTNDNHQTLPVGAAGASHDSPTGTFEGPSASKHHERQWEREREKSATEPGPFPRGGPTMRPMDWPRKFGPNWPGKGLGRRVEGEAFGGRGTQ